MRFPRRARTSLLAVGAIAAASVLAACGSGGSGGNSKTVTIWSSVDQPVIDGLNKVLAPEAKKKGITRQDQEGQQHQPADHDQHPGQQGARTSR